MPLHDWTRVTPNDYHDFHLTWIAAIRTALNTGLLPSGYFAMSEHTAAPVVPDVLTLTHINGLAGLEPFGPDTGGVAATAPPKVAVTREGRLRAAARPGRRHIAIRAASDRRLVAVIEIVSPSNKARRKEFLDLVDKAVLLLTGGVHLLLIDPFPPTTRDPHGLHAAVWKALVGESFRPPVDKPLTLAAYAARGGGDCTAFVQPIAVGDVLPEMPLFLAPDRYVNVPLEATYQTAWAGFAPPLRGLLESAASGDAVGKG